MDCTALTLDIHEIENELASNMHKLIVKDAHDRLYTELGDLKQKILDCEAAANKPNDELVNMENIIRCENMTDLNQVLLDAITYARARRIELLALKTEKQTEKQRLFTDFEAKKQELIDVLGRITTKTND